MYVFIDESGCPGFQIDRGSTKFFVIAMVILESIEDVAETGQTIARAREELGQKPEFKFSSCCHKVRDGFFDKVRRLPFTVRAIAVDKEKIYSSHLRSETEDFYRYFVQLILKHDNDALKDARIRVDGSGDREFKRELSRYLRDQVPAGKIHSCKFLDSKRSELIQLADMCAGAIHRHFKADRPDRSRWFDMLSPRVSDLWHFPHGGE